VNSGRTLAPDFQKYRISVIRVFAGDIGSETVVATECVGTKLEIGARYLISGSDFESSSGRIQKLTFTSGDSVGWRVGHDFAVSLLGYGAGTPQPPAYLAQPDTFKQAVHAVALGVQKQGRCSGGEDDIHARWHMEVDKSDGGLQVVLAMDVRDARVWTVDLFQDYERFSRTTRVRDGDFQIVRQVPNTAGTDRIGLWARQADGQICRGSITF